MEAGFCEFGRVKMMFLISLMGVGLILPGMTRTWTSTDGRTLEGDLVRVEGEVAVVKVGRKNFRIPFSSLIEDDVAYLKKEAAKQEKGTNRLFGFELEPGKTIEVDEFMDESLKEVLADKDFTPSKMVVKISVPEDFDPTEPQKVFWMVGAVDNEADRRRGNIEMFRRGEPARDRGWIVIAADTNMGNPRGTTAKVSEGDAEFHYFLVSELAKAWPAFRSWEHACGGHSTGAEGAFFRMAQLEQAGVNVVGGFLSGCKEARLDLAEREAKIRSGTWRTIKIFQSTGDQDRVVEARDIESVTEDLKRGGVRQLKSETFAGNHTMNDEEFRKALEWFEEDEEDKEKAE